MSSQVVSFCCSLLFSTRRYCLMSTIVSLQSIFPRGSSGHGTNVSVRTNAGERFQGCLLWFYKGATHWV
jgi:hypothetical protein